MTNISVQLLTCKSSRALVKISAGISVQVETQVSASFISYRVTLLVRIQCTEHQRFNSIDSPPSSCETGSWLAPVQPHQPSGIYALLVLVAPLLLLLDLPVGLPPTFLVYSESACAPDVSGTFVLIVQTNRVFLEPSFCSDLAHGTHLSRMLPRVCLVLGTLQ